MMDLVPVGSGMLTVNPSGHGPAGKLSSHRMYSVPFVVPPTACEEVGAPGA